LIHAQTASLRRQISNLDKLRVPSSVIKKMTIKPRLTLMNERFYVQCRRTWSMPYSLQWEEQRAVNINEEAKQSLGGNGFSYFTGKNRSERDGRRHYQDAGITSAAVTFRPRKLRAPRKKISKTARAASLAVLRRFAAEFQGVPQQVVTAKGKEKSGTLPGVHFEPGAAVPPSEREQKRAVAALFARAAADNPAQLSRSGGGAETMVVFAAMDIVIIKADKRLKLGDVWLAELRDSLVATKRGATVKFNMERLAVRYFKEKDDLQYDFEMLGHVYYNQIFGSIRSLSRRRFEGLPVSLISFQISEDEYQRARLLVSGAAGPPPITQEFDDFEDDDACGGDDDGALARYEAAPKRRSKPTAAHSQVDEQQQDDVGEGMPASSAAAAATKPRRAPTDRSTAIEAMHAAESAKRRK